MIPLAQGGIGLALVMGFALLATRQVAAASILLTVQSAAVAVTAVVMGLPLLAVPPVILSAGIWLVRRWTPMLDHRSAPVGDARLGVGIGAALTILCQSQGSLALPLAIILLSVLLAASRTHPVIQVVALVAMQNGIALAGCLVGQPDLMPVGLLDPLLLPIACLALPLTLTAGLLVPAVLASHEGASPAASPMAGIWRAVLYRAAIWFRWMDLMLAVMIFAATLIIPFDALASVFAPLLGLDGLLRSCARLQRSALTALRRGSALLQTGLAVVAVCAQSPMIAWLAVIAAAAATLIPVLSWRWSSAVMAFPAAGLGVFGALLLPVGPSILAYFSLFAGMTAIAAVLPDLAPVLVVLLLRLANHGPWPPAVEALGMGIALLAVVACAILLLGPARAHRATLLQLGQVSIAALAICLGQPDGRFAGMVLLILLILSRTALRTAEEPLATLAMAGLAGVSPLGVFPGTVLAVLALSGQAPWLVVPLLGALLVIGQAGIPRRLTAVPARLTLRSLAWLPLVIAIALGYFAPDRLVHWWRTLTAGQT